MDQMTFSNRHHLDNFASKLSPVTSVGTESEIDEQIFIEDGPQIMHHRNHLLPFNIKNKFFLNLKYEHQMIETKQQLFQYIEDEIMGYFRQKGIETGNPGDFKKQFNKKLHKRVSLMTSVNQKVIIKANAGSSLLQRRLHKKMVITL